ncbi:MAG: GrpB family protein [Bacteriovoracaceae bacterium]|nr:GrpB family protein [Bacteriovoracaceae bacterium]
MLYTEKYNHDVAIQLVVNGSEFKDFIRFRDILRSDERLLREYNELKLSSSDLNEDEYREKKSKWVQGILMNRGG